MNNKVIAVFYDRDSLEFIDSTYVGGKARYYITVENLTKSGPYWYSENYKTKDAQIFTDVFPILSHQPLNNNKLMLKWTKSPYYNNIDHYVIQPCLYSTVPQVNHEFALTDTSTVENYGVPYENRFVLALKSGDTYKACSSLLIDPISKQLPYLFKWIGFDSGNGCYYLRKNLEELQVISMKDYSLLKSKVQNMSFGPVVFEASMDGSYIAGVYIFRDRDLLTIKTVILARQKQ
jgi:hypothetical protein